MDAGKHPVSGAHQPVPRDAAVDLYEQLPDYEHIQRQDLYWYERLWGVLLKQLERRTKGRFLLEFGSGPGFLLKYAERRGWLAYGIEPSKIARKYAFANDAKFYAKFYPRMVNQYDAVIATEVLEHVEDPQKLLSEMHVSLVVGGLLALSVPNDYNPLQMRFWPNERPWETPLHLHYFSPESLRVVVEEAGFDVVWQRTSFPVEILLKVPFLPRKWAWKLSRVWPAPPYLWRHRIGRHCLLIARKPG